MEEGEYDRDSSAKKKPQTLAPWHLMYDFVQHEGIIFATHPSVETGSSTAIPRLLPHKSRQSLERITARGSWMVAGSSSSSSSSSSNRELHLGISDDGLLALACPASGRKKRLRWLSKFPICPSILISFLLFLLRSRGN
ncbi:uncharacterized protein BO87DRAFT_410340 [Aspergillus neoniger CBS 115656]|uniref:Uncharacterized protein n=1 Tax=Aspergillus neoniger (strain CBS 115656) TaxID=1448310 RepID=A0A318Y769_ASPNB|nr:hypothetical protein BO87DRAFT_410340 [Aspergillus neoniger CBS 115656]PYH29719.1 hypothetical protein BO87DRAFT_410340 [Aspergillus neoniger CBS 115656]